MKKIILIALYLVFSISAVYAYELNGSIENEGGGDYSISLQNQYGHEYNGNAIDNGNGTLDVNVEDYNGESYSGIATDNGDGSYDLDLQNDSSGGSAEGTADLDN
ncbi:MAG: hypothetical protein AMJ43_05625 [Coxiella sp. DG_40]|nr:MAG: hypothetical protein AMJ43_05625 [Coxiella sp. DG_40]